MTQPPQSAPLRLEVRFGPEDGRLSFDRWRAALDHAVDAKLVGEAPSSFHGRIAVTRLGTALLVDVEASAQTLEAHLGDIRRLEAEHLALSVVKKGQLRGDYDDVSVKARSGDVYVADDTRISRRGYSDFRILGLYIDRNRAPAFMRDGHAHGSFLGASTGAGHLLARHIDLLNDHYHTLGAPEATAAAEAAFRIAAAALKSRQPRLEAEHRAALARTKKQMIVQHIDEHLYDPALSPDALCARFDVSRSLLYRLFEHEGGASRHIFDRRLDRSFDLLHRGAPSALRIGALAFDQGFKSEAHFSRAFRRRFGIAPRDVRDLGAKADHNRAQGSAGNSTEETMIRWFRTCGREP